MPEGVREIPPKPGTINKLRRQMWSGATAALIAAGSGGAACSPSQDQSVHIPKPSAAEVTVGEHLSQWQLKPAIERITDLEKSGFNIEGIDKRKELVSAMADFFCSEVPCSITPAELKQRTVFLDADSFMDEYEKEVPLSSEQREFEKNNTGEFVSKEGRLVFMNNQALKTVEEYMRKNRPDVVAAVEGAGKDLTMIIEGSILLHADGHVVASQPAFEFSGFNVNFGINGKDQGRFTRLEDFVFKGTTREGKDAVFSGFAEAATEYVATYVGTKKGSYLNLAQYYGEGSDMIVEINNAVGVTPEMFVKYFTGDATMEEYFKLVGKKVEPITGDHDYVNAGASLLGGIAIYVNGFIGRDAVESEIHRQLGL